MVFIQIDYSISNRCPQEVLNALNIKQRQQLALQLLKEDIEMTKLQMSIGKSVEEKVAKNNREYFLR